MECKLCPVALQCGRGLFKGCCFEIDFKEDESKDVEIEYEIIEGFDGLPVDFMIF